MLHARREEWADEDAFLDDAFERGWTDGLPVVPPTPQKVEAFLATVGLEPEEVLGAVPTREVTVTAEHAAINAVMAGCKAEYFPVVVAAVRAHLDEHGNCHSTTGTLSGAAQAVIVNGPIRHEIGIVSGAAALGPGFRANATIGRALRLVIRNVCRSVPGFLDRANATIGRALRLVIRNVCRSVPGFLDRATFSWPLRYSFCFGENEEASDWTPLHVQRGFAPEQSTATVASVMRMVSAWDSTSRTPEGVLDSIIATTRQFGFQGDEFLADQISFVYIMGKEHQRFFIEERWSKEQMQAYMFPRLTAPTSAAQDRYVNIQHPENVLIVAAGGAGMAETWILCPHLAWAITKPVERVATS